MLIAQNYSDWNIGLSGSTLGDQGPGSAMKTYATAGFASAPNNLAGFTHAADDLSQNGLAYCYYGNCTYAKYSTLSICPKCVDISRDVSTVSDRFVLKSGVLSLDINGGFVNVTSDTKYPEQDENWANAIGPLIVHYTALAHDDEEPTMPPSAAECVAYWCVNVYSSNHTTNVWRENYAYGYNNSFTNRSVYAQTYHRQAEDIFIQPEACYLNGAELTDVESCTFSVDAEAQLGLQNFLSEGYNSNPPFLNGSVERGGGSDGWQITSLAADLLGSSCNGDVDCPGNLGVVLSQAFQNMTAWMSNVLRKTDNAENNYTYYSYGKTTQLVLVYKIR